MKRSKNKEVPLVDKRYLLEKFKGKGGWTFARIPDLKKEKNKPFGWKKVKGTIDGYEIRKYHLMPMGDGKLFLPVNAEIRKKIKKEAGDYIQVILFPDNDPLDIPEELLICLQDEPQALHFFNSISDSEKRYYIKWIYSAKKEETRITRMAKSINRLQRRLKLFQPDEE